MLREQRTWTSCPEWRPSLITWLAKKTATQWKWSRSPSAVQANWWRNVGRLLRPLWRGWALVHPVTVVCRGPTTGPQLWSPMGQPSLTIACTNDSQGHTSYCGTSSTVSRVSYPTMAKPKHRVRKERSHVAGGKTRKLPGSRRKKRKVKTRKEERQQNVRLNLFKFSLLFFRHLGLFVWIC